jgi:hypothetical protein
MPPDQTFGVEAVLITGSFGSGKSSVAAEMAGALEKLAAPFAYVDLDFLAWGYPGPGGEPAEWAMLLRNLVPVARNFRDAGVRLFVLAGFVGTGPQLADLREALEMPLRVVRLSVPFAEIERRLGADVTTGRQDDLRRAALQIEHAEGEGIEDLDVSNDRPIGDVAAEVLAWLGWG